MTPNRNRHPHRDSNILTETDVLTEKISVSHHGLVPIRKDLQVCLQVTAAQDSFVPAKN